MIDTPHLPFYRNSEFMQYMKMVATTVGQYDTNALKINTQHAALNSAIDAMNTAFKQSTKSELTKVLEDLDNRRDDALKGLLLFFESMVCHFEDEKSKAGNLLADSMNKYGRSISKLAYLDETNVIDNLVEDWETVGKLKEAIALLKLGPWVSELKKINTEFTNIYNERMEAKAALPKEKVAEMRDACVSAYRELVRYIEAFAIAIPHVDYQKMADKLNVLTQSLNTTIDKRKKGKSEELDEDIMPVDVDIL